jgi:hypothetical protein
MDVFLRSEKTKLKSIARDSIVPAGAAGMWHETDQIDNSHKQWKRIMIISR